MDRLRQDDVTSFTTDDLSALAWVNDELRRSLEAAHKALRRFVRDSQTVFDADIDAVDPAVLRTARQQFHQGVGALELVGLPAAATVLRASEAAVLRSTSKGRRLSADVVDDIERASFALLDYLARVLAGKPVSPLAMFPQYRAVQEAAGAERVHPADLWTFDWQWRALPADAAAEPREPNASTRSAIEQLVLVMMRNPSLAAHARMSDVCADLGAGAVHLQTATLWKLAAAVFEAQSQELLVPDVFSKRIASRLLAQLRSIERGETEVSERLAQDLLFFCAQAASPGDGSRAPRLAGVRQVYALVRHTPTDYAASALGRFDPALIAQARKRVAAAKESWSAVAAGESHRLGGLSEQFALIGDSLKRLFPGGELLAAELQAAVAHTHASAGTPPPPLAMEVATGLLYVDACLEDADFDHPELAPRVRRLAERISYVRQGAAAEPLEAWMEELYRRVSDRQTMGSVVQELRVSLSEAEKLIDQFFRNPTARDVLLPVPGQLSAMRGVLSVLGMDQASAALLRMRDDVDGLATTELVPERVAQAGVFERLASNLGALGFLIDMLSVQPQLAKTVFAYDAAEGTLNPIMGRRARGLPLPAEPVTAPVLASVSAPVSAPLAALVPEATPLVVTAVAPRLIEQAQLLAFNAAQEAVPIADVSRDLALLSQEAQTAEQPLLSAAVAEAQTALEHASGDADLVHARERLSEALVSFVASTGDAVGLDSTPMPLAPATETPPAELGDDAEMREVFLEEAREVLQGAADALSQLSGADAQHDDIEALTTLRRAFHTLKGSSRMVGLKDFGDAAWVCEQLYNATLAEQAGADPALLGFTRWALNHLGEWVDEIADGRSRSHGARVVEDAARAMRQSPIAVPIAVPAAMPIAAPLEASDLDIEPTVAAEEMHESVEAAEEAADEPAAPDFAFDLDLASLNAGWSQPAASTDQAEHALAAGMSNVPAAALPTPNPFDTLDFDLDFLDVVPAEAAEATEPAADEEPVKVIGSLRIGIPLFNIYLNEADELSRRLTVEMAEWAMELHQPVAESSVALAHSLAGSSATVGFADLSHLARLLEHALALTHAIGHGTAEDAALFVAAAEEIRRLLHQFAAGFLKQPSPELLQRLADHELTSAARLGGEANVAGAAADVVVDMVADVVADVRADLASLPDDAELPSVVELAMTDSQLASLHAPPDTPPPDTDFGAPLVQFDAPAAAELKPLAELPVETALHVPSRHEQPDADERIDATDAIDAELFPFFEEEGQELLPELAARLRDWSRHPAQTKHAESAMRTLHTLKGGARLAGAMRLGEMAHRLESQIEHVAAMQASGSLVAADLDGLLARSDALSHAFEALRLKDAQAYADAVASAEQATQQSIQPAVPAVPAPPPAQPAPAVPALAIVAPPIAPPIAPPSELQAAVLPAIDCRALPTAKRSLPMLPRRPRCRNRQCGCVRPCSTAW